METEARAELERRLQQGDVPEGVRPHDLLQRIRQELLARAHTIGPGEKKTWLFAVPATLPADADLRLRFKFSSSRLGGPPVRGTWLAGPADKPAAFRVTATNAPEVVHRLDLPSLHAAPGTTLVVTYINDDPDPFTLFFSPGDGLIVQARAGSFLPNFLRAALLIVRRRAAVSPDAALRAVARSSQG